MKRIFLILFILGVCSIATASIYEAVRDSVSEVAKNTADPKNGTITPVTPGGGFVFYDTNNFVFVDGNNFTFVN